MNFDDLLSRLEGVRRTSDTTAIARCPAHDDRNPSMTLKHADDDRLLMHCKAGCPIEHITGAIGIDLSDLFPAKEYQHHYHKPLSRPFPANDILRCLSQDLYLMEIYSRQMAHGIEMNAEDRAQMTDCAHRLHAAIEVARV